MYNRDLNILYVTSFCPHGPSCGAQVRVLNIGRQLKRLGKVSLVLTPIQKLDQESLDRTHDEFEIRHIAQMRPVRIKKPIDRLRHELVPSYLNTFFSAVREVDREIMLQLLSEYDVVWVHTIRTANEFRIYRWPHAVLDIDDVQSIKYVSSAKVAPGFIRRLLDYRMSLIWLRRERLFRHRFDVLAVCSDHDRQYFRSIPRMHVIPNGFNPPLRIPKRTLTVPSRLGFIGPFQFMPNRTGIEWFIREVWPYVKRAIPDSRLRLVGWDSDKDFPSMGPDIDGLGFVKDSTEEIATWSAMIVPIRFGGGTRIKIAEAFSLKCPVVSTTIGAFGYDVQDGEELLLADSSEDFGHACVRIMSDRTLAERVSENAWKKFLNNWTWDAIGESVQSAVQSCITQRNC